MQVIDDDGLLTMTLSALRGTERYGRHHGRAARRGTR